MVPNTGGKGGGGGTAETAIFIIELQVPGACKRGPEIKSPATVIKTIVEQPGIGTSIKEKGKGYGEVGGAGEIQQVIVCKCDQRIEVAAKLHRGTGRILVIGGISQIGQAGGNIPGNAVGITIIQWKMGLQSVSRCLGAGIDLYGQEGNEKDPVNSFGLHEKDFR